MGFIASIGGRRHDRGFPARKIGGLHVFRLTLEGEFARLEGADEGNVEIGLDVIFHAYGPEGSVEDEAAVVVVEKVLRGTLGAVEDAVL